MEQLQPLLDLLGGKSESTLATVIAWAAALRLALIFLHGRIQRAVADRLNAIAASEAVDDDNYLRSLFNHPTYKGIAFGLLLVGVPLPSAADLERAIRLQREAALKESPVPINQNPT